MRDLILIYNPKAGDTYFRFSLDRFIEIFSEKNYEIRIFRSSKPGDMAEYLKDCDLSLTQAVFVAGGNGTINEVVNAMMELQSKIPIGVIPAGIENDFAKALGFGEDLEENLKALSQMTSQAVDVAKVNDRYFVNICSAGTFASLTNVSSDLKNTFGRLAYYIKGFGALSKIRKMDLRIETEEGVYEGKYALFMLINSKIRRISQDDVLRNLGDGEYDFLAVKVEGLANIARVMVKILRREAVQEKDILYIKGDHFKISSLNPDDEIKTEIDGESGPSLPIEVKVYKGALNFFVNA